MKNHKINPEIISCHSNLIEQMEFKNNYLAVIYVLLNRMNARRFSVVGPIEFWSHGDRVIMIKDTGFSFQLFFSMEFATFADAINAIEIHLNEQNIHD